MLTGATVAFIVIISIAIVIFIFALVLKRMDADEFFVLLTRVVAGAVLLFSLGPLCINGFGPQFWTLNQYDNLTITSIDSRSAVADGTKLTTEFAVEVDGIDGVIISDDPRFLSLDEGDTVNLSCHWIWQYGSANINSCRIN